MGRLSSKRRYQLLKTGNKATGTTHWFLIIASKRESVREAYIWGIKFTLIGKNVGVFNPIVQIRMHLECRCIPGIKI